jgi:hypothetical protein
MDWLIQRKGVVVSGVLAGFASRRRIVWAAGFLVGLWCYARLARVLGTLADAVTAREG